MSSPLRLTLEKPAAGGRMIARHEGRVLLVAGGIPGEEVTVRVDRVEKRMAYGSVIDVESPSPDRRVPTGDPECGGCVYAHITPERQARLKGEIVADAFARLGRLPLPAEVVVTPSPDRAYRLRARFHVKGARFGFYREQTHEICDAASTGQVSDGCLDAARTILAAAADDGVEVDGIEISETVAGDARAAHIEARTHPPAALLERIVAGGITAVTASDRQGGWRAGGARWIADPLDTVTGGRSTGLLRRSPVSFFQANRFLLPALAGAVMDAVPGDGPVFDLYAGVGLFGIALAGAGRRGIVCVEGHGASGADLVENAAAFPGAVRAVVGPVEREVGRLRGLPATIVVDPPRTGLAREVTTGLVASAPPRVVYVSCDPATLARDARLLVDGGFRLESVRGFDLFPNTAHVETLAVFARS